MNDVVSAGQAVTSRWQQRSPWLADTRLRLDALRLLWRERILRFDQGSQEKLLSFLHVPEPDGQKLALVLAACLILGMTWLTWQVRRELTPRPRDPVARAYATLCRRLAAAGLPRKPHEGAEAYAARVAAARPDLSEVAALCRRYSDLRYATRFSGASAANHHARGARDTPRDAAHAAEVFIAGVRAFRPRGSRGS